MRILVTGITGYVGSHLVPRLLDAGHEVRGFARSPEKVEHDVPVVQGDATTGEGLEAALEGVDVAYFLMHAMEGGGGDDGFSDAERQSAERFVEAGRGQGVRRVVYLGGLPPSDDTGASRHLQSRLTVERLLLDGFPEGIAFRASMVVGAGSPSFDFLVKLVDALPVMALPAWRNGRTRPIAEDDLLAYLVAAATLADLGGPRVFEVGGADEVTYGRMVERLAELRGTPKPSFGLPVSATPIASRVSAGITGSDVGLIEPLMESLEHDLVPDDVEARAAFGLEPAGYDEAVRRALQAGAGA